MLEFDIETRQFGIGGGAYVIGKLGTAALKGGQKYSRRDRRKIHRERMAMIKAGMNPDSLETLKEKRSDRNYDMINRIQENAPERRKSRNEDRANKREASLERKRIEASSK